MVLRYRPLVLALMAQPILLSAAADADTALPEVSVTAKGYAADELETPVATLSVDRAELLRRNAHNVGDALRGKPGLAVAADSPQGANPVIRGLKKESVVLLVDGIRFNSAQPAGAIASFMSVGLAERVEVVKGPSSVLYGTGALGGVINVRLPQARFEPGVQFDASASYDSASRGVRGTGVVNASGGDHALMAGASLARIDDYRSPDARVRRTGYDSDSLIGQYRFRIDGAQQLRVSVQQHTDKDVWYPGSTRRHQNFAVVGTTTVHSPRQQRRLVELGYGFEGAGERPLNVDARVYRHEMYRQVFARSSNLQRDISQTRVSFTTDGADVRANLLAHPSHLVSFGANAWRMEASPARLLAAPTPLSPLVRNDPFKDGRIEALGFYVQDDMMFGPLNVLAGLRHDTVKGRAAAVGNGPDRVTTGLARTDRALSWSLGAIYELAPLVRPYANVSRGFRAGEMRERFEASPRGDGFFYVGNPQIKPEHATQFELGVKGDGERLQYALGAWRSRITNYITGLDVTGQPESMRCPAANRGACKITINLGRATLTGVEASARYEVVSSQWLTGAYSRVRGTNEDLDEPLFQMPADELSLGWEGRVAASWSGDATLRVVRRQDRVATRFTRGTEDTTPGFATADLGLTWHGPRQSVRFAVNNVADRKYHEHLTEGVSGQEIKAPGRSLAVVWNASF
jgi:hemoglobin/transferrin/lactoferrin receptor protein